MQFHYRKCPAFRLAFIRLFALGLVAIAVAAPEPVLANNVSLIKEVVTELHSNASWPLAIAQFDNGDVLVTGQEVGEPHKESVIRLDAAGKVKWRYQTALLDPPWDLSDGPQYRGAVIMSDGSSFECGEMPRHDEGFRTDVAGHSSRVALLTHLDRDGKLIKDQLLYPKRDNKINGEFFSCARLGDGVVVVGTTAQHIPTPDQIRGLPFTVQYVYWLAAFDSAGKLRWETFVPEADEVKAIFVQLPLQISADSGFVFSAAHNGKTEVVRMSATGNVLTKAVFDGMFIIAHPVGAETTAPSLVSIGTKPTIMITLGNDLQELKRVSADHEVGEAKVVYRLLDGSLALFGEKVIPEQLDYHARVATFDSSLQHAEDFYFTPEDSSLWTLDAIPTSKPGEFVIARIIDRPTTRDDLALDFITVR
jgi:hypothetical protein